MEMDWTDNDGGRQVRRQGKERQRQPQTALLQDCLPGVSTFNSISRSSRNSNATSRCLSSNTSLEMLLMDDDDDEGGEEGNNGGDCNYKEGYETGYNYQESYQNDVSSSLSYSQQPKKETTLSIRLHQTPAIAEEYRRKHRQKIKSLLLCTLMALVVVAGSIMTASILFSSCQEDDPSVITTLGDGGQDDVENTGPDDDTFSMLFLNNRITPSKEGSPTTPNNNTYQKTTMLEMDDSKSVSSNSKNNDRLYDDERRTKILTALKNLDEEIQGDIVLMSNKTKFLVAAQVWQSSVRPPLAVVEASSTKDVSTALPILAGLQRDYNIPFRVRSGGYAYMTDYSNIPDGIVLSLTRMNNLSFGNLTKSTETTVSASLLSMAGTNATTSTTVNFQPGVTTEQFMQEVLYKHNYGGIVPSAADVGMGGFVLGGGYGLQSRLYGLAIDNVVRVEAVLMNGTEVVVENGDDLFWGLLGSGGANFAVVTNIEYRVYPSNDIKLCASAKLNLEDLSSFLQRLGDLEPDLAPEFTLTVSGYYPPDNRTSPDMSSLNLSTIGRGLDNNRNNDDDDDIGFVDLKMFWTGEDNPTSQIGLNYIETKIAPLLNHTRPKTKIVYYYFSWSGMSREKEQDGLWKSVWSAQSWNGFLMPRNNTKVVWDDIVSSFEAILRFCDYATPSITLWGGAVSKRLPNETAFPYRSSLYNVGVELLVPDGTEQHTHINPQDQVHLINAIWPSIDRHLTGAYVNQAMASLSSNEDSEDDTDGLYPLAYWGTNLNKLMILKQKFDPYHSLVHRQSIPIINATASP